MPQYLSAPARSSRDFTCPASPAGVHGWLTNDSFGTEHARNLHLLQKPRRESPLARPSCYLSSATTCANERPQQGRAESSNGAKERLSLGPPSSCFLRTTNLFTSVLRPEPDDVCAEIQLGPHADRSARGLGTWPESSVCLASCGGESGDGGLANSGRGGVCVVSGDQGRTASRYGEGPLRSRVRACDMSHPVLVHGKHDGENLASRDRHPERGGGAPVSAFVTRWGGGPG